ncbi:unnamed protein product, partial [Adineta steineri]
MFKNLKEKLATQVTKTNQPFLSSIPSPESTSKSKDSGTRTSSVTSRDDNHETNRSRLDSASSDISQFSVGHSPNYVSPPRTYRPPSDIESEYGGEESDHEGNTRLLKLQKLLAVYKNKFNQLKNAYDEVEREKDHIKNILQQHQDTSLTRISELREQIKLDKQAKEQLECLHRKEMRQRENRIEELTLQVDAQKDLIQLPHQTDHEEIQSLREKNSKLEALLTRCKDGLKIHQEKQNELTKQRDDFLQQLNEKQAVIESMMKDRHPDDASIASLEVQEHFDSDISVLLQDKQRLQEELEAVRLCMRQMENELEVTKQQAKIDKDLKEKYDDLSNSIEQLTNDKIKLEKLNEELNQQIQSSDLNLIISNQNMNISHLNEELDNLRDMIKNIENIVPENPSIDLLERIQQLKQNDIQLSQTLENQRQEHSDEFDIVLKEIQDENTYLKSQIEEIEKLKNSSIQLLKDEHEKTLEVLHTQFNNKYQGQLSSLENELKAEVMRADDKINRLNSQTAQQQEEIQRLENLDQSQKQLLNENNILKEQLTTFHEKTKQLQDDIQEKQNEINHYQVIIKELEDTMKQMRSKYEQIEKELEEKQNEIIQLNNTVEQLKENNGLINDKYQQLTKSFEQKQNEVDQLKINISTITEENQQIKEEIVQLNQIIDEVKLK